MDTTRARYSGPSRKLVVAFDIGTTHSGAAYALLQPGEVPRIKPVTGHQDAPNLGSGKFPSILYYDHDGNFCGVENGVDFQDDEKFVRVRWWKLMISPAAMKDQTNARLPKGKTITDIYADFMRHLFDSTKAFFKVSESDGELKWDSASDNIELVLTHPNGWGGPQQTELRTAAVRAGIVPDTPDGHSSVHFVTEGEASFNFCATHTQAGRNLKRGEQVLVIDAGAGTIDISAYTVLNNRPLRVEELYEPKCLLQGGAFVTARARAMAQEQLKGSKFDAPEYLAAFAQGFNAGLKIGFSDDQAPQYVKFGSPRDNDAKCGVKAGKLTLTGAQVSEFFEPTIQSTVDSIKGDLSEGSATNSVAFLVGSFASSQWLSKQLEKRLLDIGLKVCKPDTYTKKAVGAISFYVEHFVAGRIAKFTYGALYEVIYRRHNPEHVKRKHTTYSDPSGDILVPDCFRTMLPRGAIVMQDREIRFNLCYVTKDAPQQQASLIVVKYTGEGNAPQWMDTEPDNFETLCTIQADLSTAPCRTDRGKKGKTYYTRDFDVILLVGLPELKAQIGWIDSGDGTEKRSDAVVVFDNPSDWTT